VRPELIRRLYETEARGLLDEALLDEVACALYARCLSIRRATAAHNGRVECPGCATGIPHSWDQQERMVCPQCGWTMTWGSYRATYHGQKMLGGGAMCAFETYMADFDHARSSRDMLIAIDRLIHAFHVDIKRERPTVPAARNVIDANIGQCLALLDGLAYGDASVPEMLSSRAEYQARRRQSCVTLPLSMRPRSGCNTTDGEATG
jgi:hypothetical protein